MQALVDIVCFFVGMALLSWALGPVLGIGIALLVYAHKSPVY